MDAGLAADEPRLHPQPPNLNRQTAAQWARALPSPSRWRPLRTGVRLSGHWWCASPGEWGASQHHLGDGTGDSSRFAGDSSLPCAAVVLWLPRKFPPGLHRNRFCRQAHCECPAHDACIPSQHAAIAVDDSKPVEVWTRGWFYWSCCWFCCRCRTAQRQHCECIQMHPSSTSRLSRGPPFSQRWTIGLVVGVRLRDG